MISSYNQHQQVLLVVANKMQAQSYDDMCEMEDLSEQTILRNLVNRYNQDQIFTYIGPTLLAVNPYRKITKLFNEELNTEIVENIKRGLLTASPHIYYIAGKAFHSMKNKEPKQSIIISGESGAGKTESTKYCMEILTKLSAKKSHSIERKILACNPLLEAFGNSKTVRNQNSSRFGKFVQILFGKDHAIKGAKIQSYLLEKSRVTMVAEKQRNFHVFYALTSSGLLGAKRAEEYAYLNRSNCYHANNIDDQEFYREIRASFNEIGFSQLQQSKIWRLLLGILQLGNLQFDDTNHQDNTQNPCVITDKSSFSNLAQMLELQPQNLQRFLLYKSKKILKQTIYSPIKKVDCQSNRDTLSKSIYHLIFQYIIDKIEVVLNPRNQEDSYEMLTKQTNFQYEYSEIGILDIFGFQNFAKNSLQQICINFTNEKLLEQYNKKVFDSEINILKQDGLEDQVSDIVPPSNAKIITILGRIFRTINQQTTLPFEEENIINNFKNQYPKDQDVKFELTNKKIFKINHSPCFVAYSIDGFKIKNQDDLTPQINGICEKLFPSIINTEPKQEGKKNVKTILKKFQESIQKLIEKLSQGSNHFVRCIKPNQQKRQSHVNDTFMKAQIKYLGVFQTIKIRKAIFPCRKTYEDFAGIYQDLFKECHGKTYREAANIIIRKINAPQSSYRLGNNRIYLNPAINDDLQQRLREYMKIRNQKATKIQRQYRRYRQRIVYIKNLKIIIMKSRLEKLCQTCERIVKIKVNDKLFMGMHYIKSESQAKLQKSDDQQHEVQEQQYVTNDTVVNHQANMTLFSTRPYQFQINKSVVKVFEESLREQSQILENNMIQQQNTFKQEKSRLQKQKSDQFQMMKACILQLKETIKEKQAVNSVLQQNIQNYRHEIERHISEIQRLKLQNDQSSSQKQQLSEQNKLLLAEISLKNAKICQMALQNNQITGKFQKKISEVEQQKAKLEQKQDSQELALSSQKNMTEQLQSKVKYFENMVKQYEAIVDQYKLEKDAFMKEKEGLHKKILEKSTMIQQFKHKDHSNTKNQISNKDLEIKKLKEKIIRLQNTILEQCQNNEKKAHDLYELQKKLYEKDNQQKEAYQNPELFIKSLQIDELKEKLNYQKNRVQTLQQQEKKLTKKLNDQANRHLNEVAEFNNKIGMANQQIRRDHLAIKQYQAKIAQLQKIIDQQPSQVKRQKAEQDLSEQQIVYYIRHYQQNMSESQRQSFKADILKQFKDK